MSETYAICPECGLRFDTPDVDTRIAELEAELQLVTAPQPEREKHYRKRIAELEAEKKRLQKLLRKAAACLKAAHMEKRLRCDIDAALEDTRE